MPLRCKVLTFFMLVAGLTSLAWAGRVPSQDWLPFTVYLLAVLLGSGLKVALPGGAGSMSVNFPFIFLAILTLSPLQVIALTGASVFVLCRVRVMRSFTLLQIVFNVSNAITAAALADFLFKLLVGLRVSLALALVASAVAYFAVNTAPVALAIAWSKGESPLAVWRQQYPWYLPFYFSGAVLAIMAHILSAGDGWLTATSLLGICVFTIYRVYSTQTNALLDRQRHLEETEALQLRTIEGLAMAVEAKDQNTHEHLSRVRIYATEIGKALGLDEAQMKALVTASYLHDIGKLAIPEHILNKPGKLTREEFAKMKIHPVVGAEILERVRFPYPVVPIVRSHHEAWDGSGYPDGLKGAEIPIGARILSAVDCFDALVSNRPYRAAMPLEAAMEIVQQKSGTQFDPAVVELLANRYVALEAQARAAGSELPPLHLDICVENGAAPGAGFAPEPSTQAEVIPIRLNGVVVKTTASFGIAGVQAMPR